MTKDTGITLSNHFGGIAHQIENKENKLDVLRQMLADGEESGTSDYSYDSLMAELDAESNTKFV